MVKYGKVTKYYDITLIVGMVVIVTTQLVDVYLYWLVYV